MTDRRNAPPVVAARAAISIGRARLSGAKVYRRDEVPWSVAAITTDWWTAVMCHATPGAAVVEARLVSASAGTHQRHRFALAYNEEGVKAGLPAAVFTKTLPTVVTRMMGGYNGTSYAEGRFLTEIRPRLKLETPHGYHTGFDRTTLAGINVLEDIVATKQATFCDSGTEVDRAMAEQMVDLLATLHAHYFANPRLDTDLRWIANFADWFRIGSQKMRTDHYTQKSLDRAADVLPEALLQQRTDLWPATVAAASIHQEGPRSLLHSDVHIGNWYRTGAGRMGLCDWQCLTQGHWSRDLAYVLSAALQVEDRRKWERELLRRYLDRLALLTGTDCDRNEAWRLYRCQMLHAFWMWTITLCHSPMLPAMQTEATSLAMMARIGAAIADLESIQTALS